MISLTAVTPNDKQILWNLLQKYLYEFSKYYLDEINDDGNYSYHYFDEYFMDSNRKAFLIRNDQHLVGFVMIHNHSETEEIIDYSIAEFCILPAHRKNHYGKKAITQIFSQLKGKWQIKYTIKNTPAKNFWNHVSGDFNSSITKINDDEEIVSFSNL